MRVLVCGSRNWTDPEPIRRELEPLKDLGWKELHAAAIAEWERAGRPCGCGKKHEGFYLCSHGPAIPIPWFEDGSRAITVVHGDARGADKIAGEIAKELGYEVVPVPADWTKHGKAAGPIRNERMLKEFGPFDLVLAFWQDGVIGTRHMVKRALWAGIITKIIPDCPR